MAPANSDPSRAAERRLDDYLDALAGALGHADRTGPARAYLTGPLPPGARKSVEPLAVRLVPQREPLASTEWPRLERTGSRSMPRALIRAPQRRSGVSSTATTTGPSGGPSGASAATRGSNSRRATPRGSTSGRGRARGGMEVGEGR